MNIPRNDMRQAMHAQDIQCKEGKAMGARPYPCRNGNKECECQQLQQKKVVHYVPTEGDFISVGHPAFVKTVDHPNCSNTKYVCTTRVLFYNVDDGTFITENTIYKEAK